MFTLRRHFVAAAVAAIALGAAPAFAQSALNVICPVQAEWCNLAAVEFEKEAGSRKEATRKALALLSVRDEVGNDLAYEVLCSIPLPKDEAHDPA